MRDYFGPRLVKPGQIGHGAKESVVRLLRRKIAEMLTQEHIAPHLQGDGVL